MASAYPVEREMNPHFKKLRRQGKLIFSKKQFFGKFRW
jgi:hypothetical protein